MHICEGESSVTPTFTELCGNACWAPLGKATIQKKGAGFFRIQRFILSIPDLEILVWWFFQSTKVHSSLSFLIEACEGNVKLNLKDWLSD